MKRKLADVSPWILAAACTLLAVIIGVFAMNNYSREKRLMIDSLLQKGLAVIRFLDTGVRVSMRGNWQSSGEIVYSWIDHVQGVIDQLHDQQDIHFVELIDQDGLVLAGSDNSRTGKMISAETLHFVRKGGGGDPVFRMYRDSGRDNQGFQVAMLYTPKIRGPMPGGSQRGRLMMDGMIRSQPGLKRMQEELDKLSGREFAILVELDMEQFDSAVRQHLWQIVILSVVLLLVGVGGWLSLLTLQGLKGSQSNLRRIRAFNDMLVESLPVGIIATDATGLIQAANAAAEKIAGIPVAQLLRMVPASILPAELATAFASTDKQINHPLSFERVLTTGSGTTHSLLLTILPVEDAERKFVGDVLLIQDISELRQLETELRRNERLAALGRMAAGVAHELRNPLSSIKGLAVLLRAKVVGDREGIQTADILVQEVERLNRGISELLDYARPEKLQKNLVSLTSILEKAATLVRLDAEDMGISITVTNTLKDDLIPVDADKMNQVLLNLLLNAIQAMPDGGRISIRTERAGNTVVIVVEDDGEGIPEDDLARVFDPYFTTKSDGSGLGLALSAKIIEEHGGTISLESNLGRGTRVVFSIPLEDGGKEV